MKTYTGLRNLYGSITKDTSTANLTLGDQWINDGQRMAIGKGTYTFMEKSFTTPTVASQQFYQLPYDYGKLIAPPKITIGNVQYVPVESPDLTYWILINTNTSVVSDIPQYYYILNNQIGFYPTPSSSGNTITLEYKRTLKDLSLADYTTGTIVSVANGGTAVVGSGTSWTAPMVGQVIRITDSDTANKGDGYWYEISAASATAITLTKPYGGTAISAGSAAYTIGQIPILPENYQILPVYFAASTFWDQQGDSGRSGKYLGLFNVGCEQMLAEYSGKSTTPVIDYGRPDGHRLNPNNFIYTP